MLAAVCTGCMKEKPFRFSTETLLPIAAHAHPWIQAKDAEIYTPENLSDYINGGARPYVEYGFDQMIHAVYAHKTEPGRRMVIDIYEMDSPLAAYGIYSTMRPPGADGVQLGTSGFWAGGLLCFAKNRIYAAIQTPGETASDYASAMLIGGFLDRQIKLPDDPPEMVNAFPDEDLVKYSIRYLAGDMLGHRFLGAGWQATYRYRGVTHEVFVIPCDDQPAALERYEKLASYIRESGEIIRQVPNIGRAALVGKAKTFGRVFVTCSGRLLVGTLDCYDDERSLRLCRQLIEYVTRNGL